MLSENIKIKRREKGLSQQELASRLHVVRQTVSKWEQGLSVPDADLLLLLGEILETPVSQLLGETISESTSALTEENITTEKLARQLEELNQHLAQSQLRKRKTLHWFLIVSAILVAVTFAILISLESPYLKWDLNDPEFAVMAVGFHAFEWLFIRLAPIALVVLGIGIWLTWRPKISLEE